MSPAVYCQVDIVADGWSYRPLSTILYLLMVNDPEFHGNRIVIIVIAETPSVDI